LSFSTLITKQTVSQYWCLGKDSHLCRLWVVGLECFSRLRCFEEPEASWSELITTSHLSALHNSRSITSREQTLKQDLVNTFVDRRSKRSGLQHMTKPVA
ncbi:hypothetical protein KCU77_g47, partial [Aureobasidium melanogenum]